MEDNFQFKKEKSKDSMCFLFTFIVSIMLLVIYGVTTDFSNLSNALLQPTLFIGLGFLAIALIMLAILITRNNKIKKILTKGETIEGNVTAIEKLKNDEYKVEVSYKYEEKLKSVTRKFQTDRNPDIKLGSKVRVKVLDNFEPLMECDEFVIYQSYEDTITKKR